MEQKIAKQSETIGGLSKRRHGGSKNEEEAASEPKNTNKGLGRSKAMFQSVIDGVFEPIIMVDMDLRVMMINKAAKEYYRISGGPDEGLGKICYKAFLQRSSPCKGCRNFACVAKGHTRSFRRKGVIDPSRFEKVSISFAQDGSRNSSAIIRISDITEEMYFKRKMIQNEKLTALGILLTGVVHDINNPNNFVSINIPILRDYLEELIPIVDDYAVRNPEYRLFGMTYPEFREDLLKLMDNMEHGSKRIGALVTCLREFVRNREKGKRRWVDLKAEIENAVMICQGNLKRKVKFFDVTIPENMPVVFSYPEALGLVLVNLLVNAGEAADKKGSSWVSLTVEIGEGEWEGHIIIEVSDNGCGMGRDALERIFEPLYTTKAGANGTGLGLFISQNIVHEIGGHIEVKSELGKMTTFRLIVPSIGTPEESCASHGAMESKRLEKPGLK